MLACYGLLASSSSLPNDFLVLARRNGAVNYVLKCENTCLHSKTVCWLGMNAVKQCKIRSFHFDPGPNLCWCWFLANLAKIVFMLVGLICEVALITILIVSIALVIFGWLLEHSNCSMLLIRPVLRQNDFGHFALDTYLGYCGVFLQLSCAKVILQLSWLFCLLIQQEFQLVNKQTLLSFPKVIFIFESVLIVSTW